MRPENYVAFFTVCGFFIGLAFSIISIEEAFDILISTCFITFMFYVFNEVYHGLNDFFMYLFMLF